MTYPYHDKEKEAPSTPILKAIGNLCSMTQYTLSSESHVKQAFLLGLWYESFPEYMHESLERSPLWNYPAFREAGVTTWDEPYANMQKFQFIADTGDSWHQCYRDLRKLGWQRLKVHREGGRLQYLLHQQRPSLPEGYTDVHLVLDISISTCKQIQVGTETKQVPIMKTVCEDLVELGEDQEMKYSVEGVNLPEEPPAQYAAGLVAAGAIGAEVVPLVVIDDIEELNRRRSVDEAIELYNSEPKPAKNERDTQAAQDIADFRAPFQDRADAAFQDAADSYLPDPVKDDEIPF